MTETEALKQLMNLPMFETMYISPSNCMQRIPGGWVHIVESFDGAKTIAQTSCFIPLTETLTDKMVS